MSTVIEEFVAKLGWEVDATNLKRFRSQVDDLKSSLRTAFRAATIGAGIATAGLYKVMGAFSMIEDAEAAFTPLMGGAKKARDMVDALNQTAATTPFQFEQLAGAAKLLLPSMNQDIGRTIELTRMLGDTAGGDAQRMQSIVRGYTKSLMKGKVDMEALNVLMEGGSIPIIKELAESMGVSEERLFKMISAGKVSSEDLTDAFKRMTSAGGIYYKGMDLASRTLTGRISTLKDNIGLAAAELGNAFAPEIKHIVDRMIAFLPTLKDWFRENKALIAQGFHEFVQNLASALRSLVEIGSGVTKLIHQIGGLGNALKLAGFAFFSMRILPMLFGVGRLFKGIGSLTKGVGKMTGAVKAGETGIVKYGQSFDGLKDSVGGAMGTPGGTGLLGALATIGALRPAATVAGLAIYGMIDDINVGLRGGIAYTRDLLDAVWGGLVPAYKGFTREQQNSVLRMVNEIVPGMKEGWWGMIKAGIGSAYTETVSFLEWFGQGIAGLGEWLWDQTIGKLISGLETVWNALKTVLSFIEPEGGENIKRLNRAGSLQMENGRPVRNPSFGGELFQFSGGAFNYGMSVPESVYTQAAKPNIQAFGASMGAINFSNNITVRNGPSPKEIADATTRATEKLFARAARNMGR